MFPKITNITQIREAIKGKGEFVEVIKDNCIIFNYLFQNSDTFSSDLLKECRGLTFYKNGSVAIRKLHKFFNINEKEETTNIDFSKPHVILEKLDGSMITPFIYDKNVEWHTKMGKTEVADMVLPFIKENNQYNELAIFLSIIGLTPIFEFCSRKNKIVIDHPVDRLVLLAIRNNRTGSYTPYKVLKCVAKFYDIELVGQFSTDNIQGFIEAIKDETDKEGYVIQFENGKMIKIKTDLYLALHKVVSQLSQEKDVWRMIIESTIDDVKGLISKEQQKDLDKFENDLHTNIINLSRLLMNECNQGKRLTKSRKEFAIKFVKENNFLDKRIKSLMFKVYEGNNAFEVVKGFILNNLSTSTKLDNIRDLLGGIKW